MRNKNKFIAILGLSILTTIFGASTLFAEGTNTTTPKKPEVRKEIKSSVQIKVKEQKPKIEQIINDVKVKREEFNKKLLENKELVKTRIQEQKAEVKSKLANIKDEKKKASVEKIIVKIQQLNADTVEKLSKKLNQIEGVLVKIESRVSKAEANKVDVTEVKKEIEKAKTTISETREALVKQAQKTYIIDQTATEENLKAEIKNIRDTFNKDTKSMYEAVKKAHESVRNVATSLAKVPKIDEQPKQEETTNQEKIIINQ